LKKIAFHTNSILSAWKEAFADKLFTAKIVLAPGLFLLYSAVTQNLGTYVEMRKGIQLEDKLLYWLPSFDFSVPVFIVLYSSLSLIILTHLDKPRVILRVIEMHFLVAVIRQLCILLIALEPPAGLIVLRDVFLENTVYPRHSPLTKDLFFSGHVASVWLYFLCAERKYIKYIMIGSTLMMSFMILSMRVHYTYDVYGALLITTLIYKFPVWAKSNLAERALVKVRTRSK
jgi:hypothetical protein